MVYLLLTLLALIVIGSLGLLLFAYLPTKTLDKLHSRVEKKRSEPSSKKG